MLVECSVDDLLKLRMAGGADALGYTSRLKTRHAVMRERRQGHLLHISWGVQLKRSEGHYFRLQEPFAIR